MYNLNIYNVTHFKYPKESDILKAIHCGTFACILIKSKNETNNEPNFFIKRISYTNPEEKVSIQVDIGTDAIISELEFLSITNSAFIATSTKAFVIDFNTTEVSTIEFPSKNIDDKVIAAAWNCEQDSLAVAFNSGRVMVYCMNYHTYKLTLLAEDHPDHKGDENVYLGWGDVKKQFKGKGVADYLKENHPPESMYKHNSSDGSISWQFGERNFCVNSLCGEEHYIRVFDNECRLFYTITNAKIPGMRSETVFRCKRNTLATICQGDDGNTYVVLHERNGGYHNKIIPFSLNAKVTDIKFSTCGRFFFISSYNDHNYFLDIYMQSNFIWSHKFRFQGELSKPMIGFKCGVTKDDIVPLEMIFDDGIVIYELTKIITALPERNFVLVQTSNCLQLFDYAGAVIPPCGVLGNIITIDEPINYAIPRKNGKLIVVIDSMETAHVYCKICNEGNDKWECKEKIALKSIQSDFPLNWYKFGISTLNEEDSLVAVALKSDDRNTERVCLQYKKPLNSSPGTLNVIPRDEKMIKSALRFDSLTSDVSCELTFNGQLYINEVMTLDGVTSIMNYHEKYLLLTVTYSDDPLDRLLCIDIEHLCSPRNSTQNKELSFNFNGFSWSRRIEKGAILICIANTDGTVVLEIPRGNIELASVRPVILRSILGSIKNGDFLQAYHIVRRHAMKLDVLYDLAPDLFHDNINKFVKSVGSSESIIKFLLPLKNATTLTSKDFLFVKEHNVDNKKDKICDAIITSYKNLYNNNDIMRYRIICIALLVKHNHDPYEALKFLVNLHGGRYDSQALQQLADAVNLLRIYADSSEMYKQALSLYDIELVNTIAQLSGMDPQIYRRFLESCRDADPVMRRFLMSNEGSNFQVAALYLLVLYRKGLKSVQEFVKYVKDKNVMEEVYKGMNKGDGEAFERISQILIDHYISKGMYKDAACILCKQGSNTHAIKMLIHGLYWQEAVNLIMHLKKLNKEEKNTWFAKVADACVSHGKYKEAAFVYAENCGYFTKALDCYLEGRLFKEAVGLLKSQKEDDSINKEICLNRLRDLLRENLSNIEASVETRQKNFKMHYERLMVVRDARKHRAEHFLDGDDAYSEAGSVTTRSHTSASTTTRRTRKLEMKLRSLRHGGKFEDIAIMRELHDIATDVFVMAKDLQNLFDIYTEYSEMTPTDLCSRVGLLQQEIKFCAANIWLQEFSNLADDVLSADFLTENIVLLDKDFRQMPRVLQEESVYFVIK